MSSPYYNVTTNAGDAAIANAIATNTKLNITHVAFGDGNGSSPTPDKTRTTLVKEVYRQGVNKYEKHPTINNFIEVEAILPSIVGSFYIREIGLIVDGKTLISHGAVAPVFKEANSVREYRLRFTINIQDAEIVNVMLDDTLIYATQGWVDDNYVPRDEIIDNLVTNDPTKPLSAKQGKNLQDNKLDKTANAVGLQTKDNRTLKPSELSQAIQAFFGTLDSNNNSSFFCDYLTLNGWTDSSGGLKNALVFSKTGQSLHHFQADYTSDTWTIKKQIAYTDSSISGNAASATKLQNARRINNELFDGTSDITILDNTKFKADGPTASVNDVAWNAKSGVYTKLEGGGTSTVVHFLGSGSASALQFLTRYGNGGLYYRSSRDGVGFENEYEKIITEKGGTVKGGLSTNGISNTGDFSTTGDIVTGSTAGEARLRLAGTNRCLYLNAGSWGVWTDKGSEPLSKVCGGTGRTDGAAEKLVTPRQVSFSGAAIGSFTYDGSVNSSCVLTLANSGVVAGTYASTIQIPSLTVNDKGLITGVSQQSIRSASTNQTGVVQLADDLVSEDSSKALTAKQGKTLQDNKLDKTANAIGLQTKDNRTLKPSELSQAVQAFFGTLDSNSNSGFFCDYLTLNGWIDSSGGLKNALVFSKTGQSLHHFQADYTSDTWTIKKQIAYTDSSISGNAASATKLQNARRINNELFDGTSDITILDNTKFKADGPTASVNDVAWNAKSGVYTKLEGGGTSTVVHFLGSGSASALQFLTRYGNGGLYYRSSRDGVGFENEYEKIITEKGGTVKGGLSTNGISNTGDFSTTGDIVTGSTAGEARLRLAGTNRYLYLNAGSWGVWTDNGSEPLSKVCGGTGRTDGAAEKLVTARQISLSGAVSGSALFDGSGNINISTVLNNFGSLKSENGYKYLGDGLILQWGTMDYTSYPGEIKVDITFPITFPNNVLNINSTRKMAQHSSAGDGGVLLVSQSNSGASFSLNVFNSNAIGDLRGFTWFAIGY
ncbi:phage tail protein [Acinetobacter baumannii]|uniref:phage tail protein n=1 Tax=Acinetobacter baumannii TaxID=470 RepID=UPI001C49498E|nr:phage tail protein [Acinetobacter baumannii]MBV6576099.1 phage tail protein [Acinetobacter baumannii]MDC4961866.1 phage tail protein [Acinetobacter baumannii]MDC5062647.1 phage tail protein [Acinetobacter baumannii]UTH18536.1 phage tail protein [Acinetobacter baumannii]UTH22151.1 phage tail protein [Acinetobacter baumannii]